MAEKNDPPLHGIDEDEALRIILEGTAKETGGQFFRALVRNLAKALNTKGAWVTEYLEDSKRLRSLAFWFDKDFIEEYVYHIAGTPCSTVIKEGRLVHVPENVVALYPDDPDLEPMGAVSFMGYPLKDSDGKVLGHLAVLDSKPMPEEPRVVTLFQIFAARACAEVQRIQAESGVKEREEKLGRLIDSAMDAIIELDSELNITMMNAAAEKVFKCTPDELIDESFMSIIAEESSLKLPSLLEILSVREEGNKYLWIPGGLEAIRNDGSSFPAEATISKFEMSRRDYYTVILRNVNDRLEAEQRIKTLSEETQYLKEEIESLHNSGELIGESTAMKTVLNDIDHVAATDATVLISGESGTGKELVARALNKGSRRSGKPLIKVNCAAIPSSLIESEFFGHVKGAFTGATQEREGRFCLADGGTIFLDEIGELPLDLQSKLLRVLQEGEYEPVGSSKTYKVDVRVICATNRDLESEVREGKFREDLFYRLNVFPIHIPPLRERGDDIIKLAPKFKEDASRRLGISLGPLSPEDIRRLKSYEWPGNVRELQNVVERAVITSTDGSFNLSRALPETGTISTETASQAGESSIRSMKELQDLEKQNILLALEGTGWRVSGENGAAKLLGIPPTTLSSRIKALGIKRPS